MVLCTSLPITVLTGLSSGKPMVLAAGTVLVRDIYPGSSSSSIVNLTNINGTLYFTANNGTNGSELWISDGTRARYRHVEGYQSRLQRLYYSRYSE
ncbi:MAG: hypothetical protein U7123_19045 [Potamolinea sp.]